MRLRSLQPRRAFTIMELLVVIAIMAVVAGLIVGLAGSTGDRKKISLAQVELASLVTMIEAYKTKVGVYPPQGVSATRHTLLYELAGAVRSNSSPVSYVTPYGTINVNDLNTAFGATGIINARDEGSNDPDQSRAFPILKNAKSDQIASIQPNSLSLVVPLDGPGGVRPNPWHYRVGANATHNPESFDLWVEIKLRKGNRIIGNWKD